VIDWFQPWPEQALASVGKKLLSDIEGIAKDPEVLKAIENFMPLAFVAVNNVCKKFASKEGKFVYTTPKSYLEMVKLYGNLLYQKRAETDKKIFRLQNGCEKLMKAAHDVVEVHI
jgi:dynein heavy chain